MHILLPHEKKYLRGHLHTLNSRSIIFCNRQIDPGFLIVICKALYFVVTIEFYTLFYFITYVIIVVLN